MAAAWGGDVIALVRHLGGLDFGEAVDRLSGGQMVENRPRPARPPIQPVDADHELKRDLMSARRIASEIKPVLGTPGETYLAEKDGASTRRQSPTS